jgi:tRNA1Val (adenine37-N6)-methyltransferase
MKTISQSKLAQNSTRLASQPVATPIDEKIETFDALFDGKLKFYQARDGYRFSLDAVLLAHFVTLRAHEKIVDLGCGNGVVPLILAFLYPSIAVTGIEFQAPLASRARRNLELNRLDQRICIVEGDVRAVKNIAAPESFDVVVCNPPYRRPTSGRISPNPEKRIARHECEGDLRDFINAGAYLLPEKGRMSLIYSAARAVELLNLMSRTGIEPKRVRMVHSFIHSEASLILVEGIKGWRSGVQIDAPLIIYHGDQQYSAEVDTMLKGRRIASVQKFKGSKACPERSEGSSSEA